MCGIVGTTDPDDHPHVPRMLAAMTHRGPDDEGIFFDDREEVTLAMRRLSILDLDSGHQPMANEDDTVWVVFNGEIYNSPQLRGHLEAKGHRFATDNSDTEVLVHLYEEYGTDMLSYLNGMFGFVIYDVDQKRLFGARDRIGIKPLYYVNRDGRLAFASELKCLTVLPWVSNEIDFESFYHYLSLQFIPAPSSILQDVQKLPAGHYFTFDLARKAFEVQRYWQLSIQPDRHTSREVLVERLRGKLFEAVRRRQLSDVPIACSLSGGLDSAAIVGILGQEPGPPIRTYSVGFSGPDMDQYDELPLARLVAKKWNTEHHEIVVDPTGLLDELETMAWHLDEPYGGGLPSWFVYKAIAKDCKVALTGTGGDELFGNYGKWQRHERSWLRNFQHVLRQAIRWRSPAMLRHFARFPQGHLYHRYLADAVKDSILAPGRRRPALSTEGLIQQTWDKSYAQNARDAVAAVDFQMQLPEEFLTVTDRFSMAHSVEARVPFLDHELVELAFQVPAAMRTKFGQPKAMTRQIVAPLIPVELMTAPKRGFVLPLPQWTRHELRAMVGDLLGPRQLHKQGLLSRRAWNKIVSPHLKGTRDFTQQVWTMLMFQIWHAQLSQAGQSTGRTTKVLKRSAA